MYHFKNRFIHENPVVAEKINYFADYFEFTVLHFGTIEWPPLENHRSLLEKILFQLENFTNRSAKYINYHFSNRHLSTKDPIIKEHYLLPWKSVAGFKGGDYSEEIKRIELILKIKELLSHLDIGLFQNALDKIIRIILCPESLDKHNHVKLLEYYIPILVTEFAFQDFQVKELRNLIQKVSEKGFSEEEQRITSKEALPDSLLQLRENDKAFSEAATEYFKNRTLKQQLEGIYNLLKNSRRERTLFFKIGSVRSFDTFQFEYNDVKFYNSLQSRHDILQQQHPKFFHERQALAEVSVVAGDETTTLHKAIQKINLAIDYFNATLKVNARLDTGDYVLQDGTDISRKIVYAGVVESTRHDYFELGKMYEFLSGSTSYLAKRAIQLDNIYFKAIGSELPEDKVIHFWRYLESYFDYDGYQASEVIEKVSRAVAVEAEVSFIILHHALASYILNGSSFVYDHNYFSISREEFLDLLKEKKYSDVDFKRLAEVIHHPYATRRFQWLITSDLIEKGEVARKFYRDLLFETYEQRNMLEHSGIFQEKAVQKIVPGLGNLVYKFRGIIARTIKTNQYTNFKDMISSLADGVRSPIPTSDH